MDPLLTWILVGAAAVLVLAAIIWLVASRVSVRRLASSVDERWGALAEALERRRTAVEPLLVLADAATQSTVTQAFVTLERATEPEAKAQAEAALQQTLRPLVQAAASQPADSDTGQARTAIAALDDEVQVRRRDYNTGARELNAKARRFPSSLFARSTGAPRAFFEIDHAGAVAEPPRIQF